MNTSNYRFTLDIQSAQAQVSLPVLLGDTNRRLYISLTDGGEPYHIEEGCIAAFVARKADDSSLFNHCIIENNTNIRYDFTASTASFAGIVNCEIRLYSPSGRLITSPRFIMVVDSRVMYDDDLISEDEHTIIDNIVLTEALRVDAEKTREQAFKTSQEASADATQRANNISTTLENKLANGDFIGAQGIQGEKGDKGQDGTVSFDELTEAQKESLKGQDGTVSFDELTEAQKESLKGEKGDPGEFPYAYSANDLTAGTSPLPSGHLYFVYE